MLNFGIQDKRLVEILSAPRRCVMPRNFVKRGTQLLFMLGDKGNCGCSRSQFRFYGAGVTARGLLVSSHRHHLERRLT